MYFCNKSNSFLLTICVSPMIKLFLKLFSLILALTLLTSIFTCCDTPSEQEKLIPQLIAARDEDSSLDRPYIYRAFVPANWIRKDPSPQESIQDSTKYNCEFFIQEEGKTIRLTIHTFPLKENGKRIPPSAQIARWKQQFNPLDLLSLNISPDSHGGFSGLFFEGEGMVQEQPIKVIGWSMQLAPIYERLLSQRREILSRLKRADYTIKASGPPEMMKAHRSAIIFFANSFEFIEELPSPL